VVEILDAVQDDRKTSFEIASREAAFRDTRPVPTPAPGFKGLAPRIKAEIWEKF
jgi:hypothetical protein